MAEASFFFFFVRPNLSFYIVSEEDARIPKVRSLLNLLINYVIFFNIRRGIETRVINLVIVIILFLVNRVLVVIIH